MPLLKEINKLIKGNRQIIIRVCLYLGLKQHPDKTFIGRISKGFDFLGYTLNAGGITGIAPKTLQHHLDKVLSFMSEMYQKTALRAISSDGYNGFMLALHNQHSVLRLPVFG
jgi:hypothetical protein